MANKDYNLSFDELCNKLGSAYVKFLCALNEMKKENDEFLTGALNHTDCKNHFLSNAYLSMFDKFDLKHNWIYHSKAAKQQIEAKNKNWYRGLSFEHIVPKQKYLQDKCEKLVEAKGKAALSEVIELLKKYWKIAVITAEENKHLLVKTMPGGKLDDNDLFARYNQPKDGTEKIILFDYKDNPVNQ